MEIKRLSQKMIIAAVLLVVGCSDPTPFELQNDDVRGSDVGEEQDVDGGDTDKDEPDADHGDRNDGGGENHNNDDDLPSSRVELLQWHLDDLFGAPQYVNILVIDQEDPEARVRFISSFEQPENRLVVSQFGARAQAVAATNGGFGHGGSESYNSGILKIGGEVVPFLREEPEELRFVGSGAVGIDGDGQWHFRERPGDKWPEDWPEVEHALAGGHILLSGGAIHPTVDQEDYDPRREQRHAGNQHPRTAIGVTDEGQVLLVTVDGRHDEALGMSLLEFARYLKDLGCVEAVNLDGGGSTTAWSRDHGVINHPSDNDTFDSEGSRRLRTAVVIEADDPDHPLFVRDDFYVRGDFTGDGQQELARFDGASGDWLVTRSSAQGMATEKWNTFSTLQGWKVHLVGDFTGSGRDDIVFFHGGTGNWVVSTSSGDAFTTSVWGQLSTIGEWETHLVGDFDGSGSDDIASFDSTTGEWTVSVAKDDEFDQSIWAQFNTTEGWATHLVGDFNGSGRSDIASFHGGTGNWVVSRSTGNGLNYSVWSQFNTTEGWATHLVGDFNGSGRSDIASFHTGTGRWMVSQSSGSEFSYSTWAQFSTTQGWKQHLVGDFNGSGRSDIASFHRGTGNWVVSQSSGTDFVFSVWGQSTVKESWGAHFAGDFDGSGSDDIASFHPVSSRWSIAW